MKQGFISYAHEDGPMCQTLLKHLKALEIEGIASFWADHGVEPGDPWKKAILDALDRAEIALFLISKNMFWSRFIREVEWPRAKAKAEKGDLLIVPVILGPCIYQVLQGFGLAGLQAVPEHGKPISNYRPRDKGYFDAAQRIADRIQKGDTLLGRSANA